MDTIKDAKFQVFIEGVQVGNIGRWKHAPLMVASQWDEGGDQEKYEVLAAIRRTYNPDNKNNIRGNERQTPAQIGRAEGFTELSYKRATSSASLVVIVLPVMAYRCVVPVTQH
jgi:hypothetical protein